MNEHYDTPEKRMLAAKWFKDVVEHQYWTDMICVMERDIYERLVHAETSEDRVMVKAEATVLRKLPIQMQALIDAGAREVILIAQQEAKRQQKS